MPDFQAIVILLNKIYYLVKNLNRGQDRGQKIKNGLYNTVKAVFVGPLGIEPRTC